MSENSSLLREKIKQAQKEAMIAKDQTKLSTVRLIMATLKDRDIQARSKGVTDGIEETEVLSMLQSMIKQRHDSVKMYEQGGRPELAEREQAEIRVIEGFLPQQLSDEELTDAIRSIVDETNAEGMKDMGKVMGVLKTRYAGQIDMGKASAGVKAALN